MAKNKDHMVHNEILNDKDHGEFIKGLVWRRLILSGVALDTIRAHYPLDAGFEKQVIESFGRS